jgi:streptogramin lyase
MRSLHILSLASVSLIALAGIDARAADQPALSGRVGSAQEGAMEGVLVTAAKDGATITTTVVTDDKGAYAFPAAKLGPGHYSLKIRATGYQLEGSAAADVAAAGGAKADLTLVPVKNIVGQLTNAEWLASFPGTREEKLPLLGCTNCHTLQRIAQSSYDADQFIEVMGRMARYANNSFPLRPQLRVSKTDPVTRFGAGAIRNAHYMATINLSQQASWPYGLKTLPRVKGKGTRVVITEYNLPRPTMMPHDVITDDSGMVWFSDFATNVLGSLDPKTGKITEHPYPKLRDGYPEGSLNLEPDHDGNLWLGMMFQGGIAKYDKAADKFTLFQVPERWRKDSTQQGMVVPTRLDVDGRVWMVDNGTRALLRMNVRNGEWDLVEPFPNLPRGQHSTYGIGADAGNNLFFTDYGGESVGRVDAKTGEVSMVATPTKKSKPRRGHVDGQGRWWFAEFYGDHAGVYDPKTNEVKEWKVPTEWTAPYDALADRTGTIWTAGMETDRIVRIDPKTGETIEYPLPRQTNIRRIFVDNRTDPVTFWVGNNEGAAIMKLEFPQ